MKGKKLNTLKQQSEGYNNPANQQYNWLDFPGEGIRTVIPTGKPISVTDSTGNTQILTDKPIQVNGNFREEKLYQTGGYKPKQVLDPEIAKNLKQQKEFDTILDKVHEWESQENYKNRKMYEPSQSAKNIKAGVAAGQLAAPMNIPLKAFGTGADLGTAVRYAANGQWSKAKEDLVQAGLPWLPFLSQKKMINLSKNGKSAAYVFNEAVPKINKLNSAVQKTNDLKTISEVKFGWLDK